MRGSKIGKKYGALTVKEISHKEKNKTFYKCVCDCGAEITKRGDTLARVTTENVFCSWECEARKRFMNVKSDNKKAIKKKEKQIEKEDYIKAEMLIDKTPKDAIELIKIFKSMDLYDAYHVYYEWRKRYKKDKNAYIS